MKLSLHEVRQIIRKIISEAVCPACGDKDAYIGLHDVECPNPACKFHSEKQEKLVGRSDVLSQMPVLTGDAKKDHDAIHAFMKAILIASNIVPGTFRPSMGGMAFDTLAFHDALTGEQFYLAATSDYRELASQSGVPSSTKSPLQIKSVDVMTLDLEMFKDGDGKMMIFKDPKEAIHNLKGLFGNVS